MRFFYLAFAATCLGSLSGCAEVVTECDPEPPPPRDLGYIYVHQYPPGTTTYGSDSFSAVDAGFLARFVDCVVTEREGDCHLERCTLGASEDSGTQAVDGGPITVVGGLEDVTLQYQSPDGYGPFDARLVLGPLFEPGDVLTLSSAGSAAVPAMSASIVAPPHVVVTAPSPADGLSLIDPIHVTWTGAGEADGVIIASVITWPESTTESSAAIRETVVCEADPALGALTMPASLLEKLSSDMPFPAELGVKFENREAHEEDDWRVTFQVSSIAAAPTGGRFAVSEAPTPQ